MKEEFAHLRSSLIVVLSGDDYEALSKAIVPGIDPDKTYEELGSHVWWLPEQSNLLIHTYHPGYPRKLEETQRELDVIEMLASKHLPSLA